MSHILVAPQHCGFVVPWNGPAPATVPAVVARCTWIDLTVSAEAELGVLASTAMPVEGIATAFGSSRSVGFAEIAECHIPIRQGMHIHSDTVSGFDRGSEPGLDTAVASSIGTDSVDAFPAFACS